MGNSGTLALLATSVYSALLGGAMTSIKGNNVDMAVECNPSKESEKPVEWVHSYFIRKSLSETKILYENLVDRIGSTKLDNYVNGEDDE